ncbi:MAG: HAMP domain-containing sensor histidine kinase [Eubacteriales bacterium]
MKYLKLSVQITLVFVAAFIITSVLVVIAVTKSTESLFEEIVYKRMETEGKAIAQYSDVDGFEQINGVGVIKYASDAHTYISSDNIKDFVDDESIPYLIGKTVQQTERIGRYSNKIAGKQIFYVILKYEGFFEVQDHDVFIILTDNAMKTAMLGNLRTQILHIFFFSFVCGYIIVLLWIFRLVIDTKHVSTALKNIGSNYYKTKLTTQRKDEIGDLVQSAEAMREKIVENEKQKQEIIQGVSHDLKTPIAVMHSYAEALKDGLSEPDEVADVVEVECERLNHKVTELINMTRLNYLDLNRGTLNDIRMDLLIEDTVKSYRHMAKAKIVLDLKPVSFLGERESWRVVLQCLMDNAIRYAKKSIVFTLDKDRLSISNDGPNIAEDRMASIFNAFEKSADGNFGIGLATVRRTAELFGYIVTVKNTETGVCFKIYK